MSLMSAKYVFKTLSAYFLNPASRTPLHLCQFFKRAELNGLNIALYHYKYKYSSAAE